MQRRRETRIVILRPYPTGRATRLPVPRPTGLEPPRVETPGAAMGQWPRHHRLDPVARLSCERRLRAGGGPTLCRHWRGVGARTARRGLPLLAIMGPARSSLMGSRPRDDDIGLRRALEESVEMGRHPLRVVAAVVALVTVVLVGRVFLWLPPPPGLRPTCLQRLSLEIFLVFLLLF